MAANEKSHLLVVDDNPLVLGAMSRILRRYRITTCATVREAREAVADVTFDAIVCDIQLTDGNGLDFFDELQATHAELARRVLFVSGAADVPHVRARLELTGCPYLLKPFAVPRFLELVASLVGQSRTACRTANGT